MAKKTFFFYGKLREFFPEPVSIDCNSVEEGLRGLTNQVKALKRLKPSVKVVGFDSAEALQAETSETEIHVVPDLSGGKNGGFLKIVIGAVLVVIGYFFPPLAFLIPMGLSLALGGVMELMSPSPKIDLSGNGEADPEASKYLGASRNTVKIGTRIPYLYGETLAHGHFISFNVDAKQVQV